MVRKRRSKDQLREIDALVECLREFIRLNYMTAAGVARQIGVRDTTIYDWLLGRARPAEPKRIAAFLDSLPSRLDVLGSDAFAYHRFNGGNYRDQHF
jgi:hypothetical protein